MTARSGPLFAAKVRSLVLVLLEYIHFIFVLVMAQQQPQSKLPQRARYAANNRKYGTPLPILFPSSPSSSSTSSKSILTSFLPSLSSVRIEIQHITGEYDPITGSVWITDPQMMDLAFQKGFFGKGSLSRSEPSWRARRVGLLKGGDSEFCPFSI